VNVIRSCNTGIDGIALDDGWKGKEFPEFPLLPSVFDHLLDPTFV
jgi:hypothetical protein